MGQNKCLSPFFPVLLELVAGAEAARVAGGFEALVEPPRQPLLGLCVGRLGGDVAQLVRVFFQVIQFLGAGPVERQVVQRPHGRVVAQGTPDELQQRFGQMSLEDIFVETVAQT